MPGVRDGLVTNFTAGGPALIDDFEDQDSDEYSFSIGDSSLVAYVTSPVWNGTYALGMTANNEVYMYSQPGDGLDNYFDTGETVSVWHYAPSGAGDGDEFRWAVQSGSPGSHYAIQFNYNQSSYRIYKNPQGVLTEFGTLEYDVWEEAQITWLSDGSIDVTVYDHTGSQKVSGSATDSSYSDGGVGWRVTSNDDNQERYFDYGTIQ